MVMFAEYVNASVRTVNSGKAIISFLQFIHCLLYEYFE